MAGHRINEISIADVKEELIKVPSAVVFDWDNTLKQYNSERRSIKSGVDKNILLKWKYDLKCHLFIISAIRPSKINMETILIEVERLELADVFIDKHDAIQIIPNKYARKGNVIICGYDKAETFMDVFYGEKNKTGGDILVDGPGGHDMTDGTAVSPDNSSTPVLFFDDEQVNIDNFSQIVHNSICYHII